MNSIADTPKILSPNTFPVVGVGASAGGLEAFRKLLKSIPENAGMAYVLVQHLDPKHESLLPELLQKVTNIPVVEITDDIKVQPNHIYIIPSNKLLLANDGVLQLSPRPPGGRGERNMPIDLFFNSLAEIHQSHAIGVVLSGTATDGTEGLKAIKEQGGLTFAQDETSATYPGMPSSAALAGVVDFILPPEAIPEKITEILRNIQKHENNNSQLPLENENFFKQIIDLLRLRKGTDFTFYKQTTIRRRILRRMVLNNNKDTAEYLTILQNNKEEQDRLYQDLLIPVTSFFRDFGTFANLCGNVLPHILKSKKPGEPIRIWVAGCSTGQEAYSMAICLKELLGEGMKKVQIFATDISEPAIAKARAGLYTYADVATMPPNRLATSFTKTNSGYLINKQVRDCCVFALHNFLKDPPFSRMDLVSCRNVLIYMETYLQVKALTTFHYALMQKGFLLLGKTESVGSVANLFSMSDPENKNEKFFVRKNVPGSFIHVAIQPGKQSKTPTFTHPKNEIVRTDFQKTADDIILDRYTPAGVVVNDALDIVHFRGSTSNYLEQLAGKPSHNVLTMAKHKLSFELRNILHKAKKENITVLKENIPVQINGRQTFINIEAIPLPNIVEPHYLILFHPNIPETETLQSDNNTDTVIPAKMDDRDIRIAQLELELQQLREDMSSITEEQETANEELQSANEELLSGSEELQSLNEELETSKEELQSINEELIIVNQEMYGLNQEMTEARDYAEAIISNTRKPILVLDKRLLVKTANEAFYKTFQVDKKETIGRLIYDLGNRQWNIPGLRTLLEELLPQKKEITDFEVRHTFQNIGERVMLLNGHQIKIEKENEKLILLSIDDVTEREQHLLIERDLLNKFQKLILQAPVAMCILNGKDYTVELANDAYLQLVDKKHDFINKPLFQSLPELATQGIKENLDNVLQTANPYYGTEVEILLNRRNELEQCFLNLVYQPMLQSDNSVTGIIVVATEVTEQVRGRKKMEAQATMIHNLLMNAPAFISTMKGPDHVFELVNERYQNLFGKRKIQGKLLMDALPELEGQGFDILLDKVYETGERYVGINVPITLARDEGLEPELRYFNFSYQPMYDDDHSINSILVFGYEVTDQVIAKNRNDETQKVRSKELEDKVELRTTELNKANGLMLKKNEDLEKINKELESFTYLISHDLQEPLRKINIYTSLLLEKEERVLSDAGKDYFVRIQQSAVRMRTLIQDLVAYSYTNFTARKFEETSLDQIIEEVKTELSEIIREKGGVIESNHLGNACINTFQFRQLLNNLVANAIKFSPHGTPPHVIITSQIAKGQQLQRENPSLNHGQLVSDQEYFHLVVADSGIGFEPIYNEQIFAVFQRLHAREAYPGTGIGLAIVKKIVDHHNGLITASGQPNKGAIFNIYIPQPPLNDTAKDNI